MDYFGPFIVVAAPLLSFALVGSLLVIRRAGGPIGWLLGAAGAFFQLGALADAYGHASLEAGAALPGGELALWSGSFIWTAVLGSVVSALVLFPDGRPPGRAFAILLWAFAAFVVAAAVGSALADQPIVVAPPFVGPQAGDLPRSIPNPFALHGPLGDLMLLAASAFNIFPALMLIAPAALVVRFRRSHGVEREQLKWLTYTAAVAFGLVLIGFVSPPGTIKVLAQAMSLVGVGLLPVAIGIAITQAPPAQTDRVHHRAHAGGQHRAGAGLQRAGAHPRPAQPRAAGPRGGSRQGEPGGHRDPGRRCARQPILLVVAVAG